MSRGGSKLLILDLFILLLMLRNVLAIANVRADSLTTACLQFGDRLEVLDFLTRFLRGLQGFLSEFQVDEIDVEEEGAGGQ